MTPQNVKIDPIFLEALNMDSLKSFNVKQLRDLYIKKHPEPIDSSQARKFVYKQLCRFVKIGLLKKSGSKGSHEIRYSKTERFFSVQFQCLNTTKLEQEQITIQSHLTLIEKLDSKIKQYQVDIASAIGESEEYMQLFSEFPELKVLLEQQYLIARDNSSKLLGKIKALNNIKNTIESCAYET